jgi:hypothetical protein
MLPFSTLDSSMHITFLIREHASTATKFSVLVLLDSMIITRYRKHACRSAYGLLHFACVKYLTCCFVRFYL